MTFALLAAAKEKYFAAMGALAHSITFAWILRSMVRLRVNGFAGTVLL